LFHKLALSRGMEMGRKIGAYVAANILQPADVARAKSVIGQPEEKSVSPAGLEHR
jgi:hypothetical protein